MKTHILVSAAILFFNCSNVFGQLNGTYTIGNAGDYKSLNEAVQDLAIKTMNGSVTFNYMDGAVDTIPVTFPNGIIGLTAKDSLLIQSTPGATKRAYLNNKNSSPQQSYMIDCSLPYVTFNELDFFTDTASGAYNAAIILGNGRLTNSTINCPYASQPIITVLSNASVINCTLNGNNGTGILVSSGSSNVLIQNNTIENYFVTGLYSSNGKNNIINKNTFIGGKKVSSAITLLYGDSITISQNTILEYALPGSILSQYSTGIILRFSNNCLLNNNMISSEGIAYRQYSGTDNRFEHNSLYSTTDSTDQPAVLLTSVAGHGINYFRNNAIMSESPFLIRLQVVAGAPDYFKEMDYNDWFSTQSTPEFQYQTTTLQKFNNLEDWSNATKRDIQSINVTPEFYSKKDLHTNSLPLMINGYFLPYITEDIDGESRSPQKSAIGADQNQSVSVNEELTQNNLLIYPNPSHSEIWVKTPYNAETVDISVVDLEGKLWIDEKAAHVPASTRIDISALPPGLFMIRLSGKNQLHYATFIKL